MVDNTFFEASKEQSIVKATIVTKYFEAWAKVMISAQERMCSNADKKIAYIDLFAGPGRYEDGIISTPLLIVQKAINNESIKNHLVTIFNDMDENNTKSLENEFTNLPGISSMKYKPKIYNQTVGEEIVKMFEGMNLVPTLFFVDPWGYKGLSLRLINSVLKNWGCDCIFFFNYNRINMGITNPFITEHIDALFGKERGDKLRQEIQKITRPSRRELFIIDQICCAIKEMGPKYILPFRFKDNRGNRTSHHLIFVSKAFKGYEIMKDIMAKECSSNEQGVPSFEYNPADVHSPQLLFKLSRPIDELGDMLCEEFSGKTITMDQIYKSHNIDRPYISKNYKDALKKLETEGRIKADPHKKGTFGPNVKVTFP